MKRHCPRCDKATMKRHCKSPYCRWFECHYCASEKRCIVFNVKDNFFVREVKK